MCDPILDFDSNDIFYQVDDDFAIGPDGNYIQKAGNNLGFDLKTGELRNVSGWSSSEEEDDIEDI